MKKRSARIRTSVLLLMVCSTAPSVLADTDQQQPSERYNPAMPADPEYTKEELWAFIEATADTADRHEVGNRLEWWLYRWEETMQLAHGLCCKEGAEPLAALFVEKFGKTDAARDALLLLGHNWLLVPEYGGVIGPEFYEERPETVTEAHRHFYQWKDRVAEAQVKHFLEHPRLLDRYFRACMWSQLPFGLSNPEDEAEHDPEDAFFDPLDPYRGFAFAFENLSRWFPENRTPEADHYWYYARQFVFMLKALGQEGRLKDVEPAELYALFEPWRRATAPHVLYIVPHETKSHWYVDRRAALNKAWKSQDYHVPSMPFEGWPDNVPRPTAEALLYLDHLPRAEPCNDLWPPSSDHKERLGAPIDWEFTKEGFWRFIEQQLEVARTEDIEQPINWWANRLNEANKFVWGVFCAQGAEPVAELFVEKFGGSGAADIFLMFSSKDKLIPGFGAKYADRPLDDANPPADDARLKERWEAVIAEAQVKHFLEQPELFDRYYRACMWSQLPFGLTSAGLEKWRVGWWRGNTANVLASKFEALVQAFPHNRDPGDGYYWTYARQFMFLAKATGHESLFDDATPEGLYPLFEEWRKRVTPHIWYLLPEKREPQWRIDRPEAVMQAWDNRDYVVPSQPFPTWDLPIPPPMYGALEISVSWSTPAPCDGVLPAAQPVGKVGFYGPGPWTDQESEDKESGEE